MYLIVANLSTGKEAVDRTDSYIEALQLQKKYSMAFKAAVEIVKV